MDLALQDFLRRIRSRARNVHLQDYEEVSFALEGFLRRQRGSLQRLRKRELHSFLGYWYLRHHRPQNARNARRFCAATSVLVRWLVAARADKGQDLTRAARRAARETARAARLSELLDQVRPTPAHADLSTLRDDHWQVVMRSRTRMVVRSMTTHEMIGPVQWPEPWSEALVAAVAPGVILNLQLARVDGGWCVLDHGFCYPAIAAPALQRASAGTG